MLNTVLISLMNTQFVKFGINNYSYLLHNSVIDYIFMYYTICI